MIHRSCVQCSLHLNPSTFLARFNFKFASWIFRMPVCIFNHEMCNKLFMHIVHHFPLFDEIVTNMKIEPWRRNNGLIFEDSTVQCTYLNTQLTSCLYANFVRFSLMNDTLFNLNPTHFVRTALPSQLNLRNEFFIIFIILDASFSFFWPFLWKETKKNFVYHSNKNKNIRIVTYTKWKMPNWFSMQQKCWIKLTWKMKFSAKSNSIKVKLSFFSQPMLIHVWDIVLFLSKTVFMWDLYWKLYSIMFLMNFKRFESYI